MPLSSCFIYLKPSPSCSTLLLLKVLFHLHGKLAKSRPSTSLVLNRSERNNFRPISVLCNHSKLLKKHIQASLYTFLIKHSLLFLAQSGFQAFHSCTTALTRLVDKWTSNMEECLLNGIVLLDLRKAFDLVNTDILLQKLEINNLDDNSLCWFKSYLQGRHQSVQFKGKMSVTIHPWCDPRQYPWTTFIYHFYE